MIQAIRKVSERIDNKELLEMLGRALKEAKTPSSHMEPILPRDNKENPRLPGSIQFHYRNHPGMMRMSRAYNS